MGIYIKRDLKTPLGVSREEFETRNVVRYFTRQMIRIEPRFKEIEHTPGPGDYETSSVRSHSPSASITSARRTLDKKELTPGP